MLKNLFKKRQYATIKKVNLDNDKKYNIEPNIPKGKWINCPHCKIIIYADDLNNNNSVCTSCGFHFRISAKKRINQILDKNSFVELFEDITSQNPLDFDGYEEKLKKYNQKTDLDEAVITGYGNIDNKKVVVAIMDSNFMMGSMGIAVGEKITKAVEYATYNKLPIIIFSASGGARMQEGIFSLMQMAKISSAIGKHDKENLLYISVLTNPTTGGVSASFSMQGDIIIAEPGAIIGFAGRRVIENTIGQKLPEYFQTSEFILEKGFIDDIVKRENLKIYLSNILSLHEVSCNG